MKKWTTEIKAFDPIDGRLKTWIGDIIEAPSFELAEQWCQINGKGYLRVIGELISEIEVDEKGNLGKEMDYSRTKLN